MLGVPVTDVDPMALSGLPGLVQSGDLIVGFPLLWKKCSEMKVGYAPNVAGVTSTGPCSPEVVDSSLAAGLARMVEIHGSTETGGLGYRFDHREPYTLMEHWFTPVSQGGLSRRHPSGGEAVWFELPDGFDWTDERGYLPAGRKDMAVQIAGINVYPSRVRQILLQHPMVVEATVRLMRPEEGDRLKAFIVPREQGMAHQQLVHTLRDHVSDSLSAPERPRSFTFGRALPVTSLGKDSDWDSAHPDNQE